MKHGIRQIYSSFNQSQLPGHKGLSPCIYRFLQTIATDRIDPINPSFICCGCVEYQTQPFNIYTGFTRRATTALV
jgi:hypothetical protein